MEVASWEKSTVNGACSIATFEWTVPHMFQWAFTGSQRVYFWPQPERVHQCPEQKRRFLEMENPTQNHPKVDMFNRYLTINNSYQS